MLNQSRAEWRRETGAALNLGPGGISGEKNPVTILLERRCYL